MKKATQSPGTAKKTMTVENVFIIACIVFAAGFVSGVVFSAFRTTPPQPTAENTNTATLSQEQSAAIMSLQKQLNQDPNNAEAWARLGDVWFDSDHYQDAIDAYTKSLAIKPDNANVLTDLGIMYRRTKQFDKALDSFSKATRVDPSHTFSRLNQGIVLFYDLDKKEEALKVWDKLLTMAPDMRLGGGVLLRDQVRKLRTEIKNKK